LGGTPAPASAIHPHASVAVASAAREAAGPPKHHLTEHRPFLIS